MRIAFYAPLKPPHHPVPSGDRLMARLLIKALEGAGYNVDLAARLRSRVGDGDILRQVRLAELGGRLAHRLIRRYQNGTLKRPDAWFTYHLYYKAPDWIGPLVAKALDIPYIAAEASHAPKRQNGPWRVGHEAVEKTLARADAVFSLNREDMECLTPVCRADALHYLPPFAEIADWQIESRSTANLAEDMQKPVELVTVAMMRSGDKLASYQVLAEALGAIPDDVAWRLGVIGDGPARADVEALFARYTALGKVRFVGQCDQGTMRKYLARSHLFVWPAINEAFGMALLEAQAAGLPVLAGKTGGVPGIVADGKTGWLVPVGDATAFEAQLVECLRDREKLARFGQAAALKAMSEHDIDAASRLLASVIDPLIGRSGPEASGKS